MLPKDNEFQLKINRKCTFDTYPLLDSHHKHKQSTEIEPPLTVIKTITENVETQTESHIVQPEP
jgi:hypothetical protein